MKKAILILILLCMFLLIGCQQIRDMARSRASSEKSESISNNSEMKEDVEAIVEDDKEVIAVPEATAVIVNSSFDETKEVTFADGALTIDIPTDFSNTYDYPNLLIDTIGDLTNKKGEESVCQLTAVHFFQAEDPAMDYNAFNESIEGLTILDMNINTTFERILEVTLNEYAKGFITKYDIMREKAYDEYALFIASNGVYYKITFLCSKGHFSDDVIIDMFQSLKIDTDKEQKWVDSFEVNVNDGWYTSAYLDGAKVHLGPHLTYNERFSFAFRESILGVALQSHLRSLHVNIFPKDIFDFDSYEEFMQFAVKDVMHRGLYESDLPDRDISQNITDDGQLYFVYMYVEDFYIVHFGYEYEDAYYLAEIVYLGDNMDALLELIDCAASFTAPGKNLTPVFTPEDDDWADGNPYEDEGI